MVARINPTDTFDTIENHILFTRSAINADDDARALLVETDGWLPQLDSARLADRTFRIKDMDALAARSVANARLDIACLVFGRDMLHAVGDRLHPRFVGFFPVAPSRWVKQPFDRQIRSVQGWLTVTGDAVLDQHRPELSARVTKANDSQQAVAAVAPARGINWEARSELADSLTRMRDGLHRALSERADELKLPRDWADAFFRIDERESSAPPAPPQG